MTKAELESKSLADLHSLAAKAGVERFRMLSRAELVAKLADGGGDGGGAEGADRAPRGGRDGGEGSGRERPRRRRRRSGRPERDEADKAEAPAKDAEEREAEKQPAAESSRADREPAEEPARTDREPASAADEPSRPRRRRRRRFGRRGKNEVTLQGLLLPPEAGRQTVLAAASREACTALLRSVAADLAADSKGPDPVALLIDPSPEELADWKRDAPQAEIVSAGQPRHADDALAQAKARAGRGEDVILLVDSLTRLGEAYGDADAAKDFFDAGRGTSGSGSLTVVAALERS